MKKHRGVEIRLHSLTTSALERGWVVTPISSSLCPGKTRYPLYRRLHGSCGPCEMVRKIPLSPGTKAPAVLPIRYPRRHMPTYPTLLPRHVVTIGKRTHLDTMQTFPRLHLFYRVNICYFPQCVC
jgi:hypothetical protein